MLYGNPKMPQPPQAPKTSPPALPQALSHALAPNPPQDPILGDVIHFARYPIYFVDYLWIIVLYVSIAFWLAVLIDGVVLPPYDQEKTDATPTWLLFVYVLLQFAVQGFLVLVIGAFLQAVPSPVGGVMGYDAHGKLGVNLIRNPAVMTIILFFGSPGLQGRLRTLLARFDRNQHRF